MQIKNAALILLIFVCTQTFAQSKGDIVMGRIDTLHSAILNEKREILIYVPKAGNNNVKVEASYPVLYLLDGYAAFHSVTGVVQHLSSIGKIPKMIVVAISNTDRVRDLTPTHSTEWSDGTVDSSALKTSGGGEKFILFLEKELIPHIESNYHTDPYRMFVGHSLGGLTVLNTLINHPSLFNSYVAIDPSIWWDQQSLLKKANTVLAQKNFAGKKLFYAAANTMEKGMDMVRVVKDTAIKNVHVRNNLKFREVLLKNKKNQLVWDWKYYHEDNHSSVPLIAAYDAFRSFFKGFELADDLNDPLVDLKFVQNHYKKVSAMLGYNVMPPENTVNILGYINLENKDYAKAYSFFKMNIDLYPESFNVYDSMGDYYIARGDKKKAKELLLKALMLNEHHDTRKKFEGLR
ncbi:alpha/beta hydrolase-fold protein [Pedobacter immunditicola]|uniref:alpha/beta hydrolase-fold protein n=1 Tax=Pedobacter immunditicola TaxID=3133440 RepID=UPI0030B17E35